MLREGRLIDARGSLAGVHIDMIGALRRLGRDVGLPLETALAMITSIPARAARLQADLDHLAAVARATIALLDPEGLQLRHPIVDGEPPASGPTHLRSGRLM